MRHPDEERRAICRECGRGRDAPHKDTCESGQVARARAEWPGLHVVMARYLTEHEDRRN